MALIIVLFVVGLVLICLAGDRFVDAAVAIARRLGIPQIVVGATIVSIGTTLPEVLVSATAAFQGSAAISAGNAFGSIICNTAFIAGLGTLLKPSKDVDTGAFNWRILFFAVCCGVMIIVGALTGQFNRLMGLALLVGMGLYSWLSMRFVTRDESSGEEDEGAAESLAKPLITLVISAALLFVGARLLVDNGILIAEWAGVPERVIAVTFIALGTSLPELVTMISSMVKGHGDVGLGNIVGANVLNLLLVIGIPATVTGFALEAQTYAVDMPLGLAVMAILTVPIMIKKRAYRWQGALLLAIYVGYCVFQFIN